VLAAVAPSDVAAFLAAAAARGVVLTDIGEIQAGTGVRIEDRDGRPLALAREGWDHF
jgi:thiamine monophosphate kinase